MAVAAWAAYSTSGETDCWGGGSAGAGSGAGVPCAAKRVTSSGVTLPAGPVAGTRRKSTPSWRASRLVAGYQKKIDLLEKLARLASQ